MKKRIIKKMEKNLRKKWTNGWKFLGEGRNRIVYLSPDKKTVLKIPSFHLSRNKKLSFSLQGISDNFSELKNQGENRAKAQEAKEFPYSIYMEYVEPYQGRFDELPHWTWDIDCAQVGYDINGHLVAYDYA